MWLRVKYNIEVILKLLQNNFNCTRDQGLVKDILGIMLFYRQNMWYIDICCLTVA